MRRIPTLFARDPEDRRFVIPQVTLGCEWVLAGEGRPTRMYDGVAVLFDPELDPEYVSAVRELQGWWVRHKPKLGSLLPEHFQAVDDGGSVGWIPADRSPVDRWLADAVRNINDGPRVGTHELIGPKINRDPERVGKHVVIAHADADLFERVPRDFEGLSRWLATWPYEGVVWHHPDGRMAKLKRKDVRRV